MDEKELVQWMRVVDQRLARLEVQGDATPGAPDLPDVDSGRLDALIPKPLTWQQIAGAFSKRYESTRGLAWHYGPHVQALEDVAAWVNKQSGDTKSVAVRLLDAFFANNYAATRDFPPKLLASQCGRYFNPPAVAAQDEPNEEAINARRLKDRRKQEMDELAKKLARDLEEAVPPPGSIEDMMANIGKTLK